MVNMERYTALYVYTHIVQNQLVGDVRAPLLWVVPVESRYVGMTFVTYEQPWFLSLNRTNSETMEISIRDDIGKLVSFESRKSIVTQVFRRKRYFTDASITSI